MILDSEAAAMLDAMTGTLTSGAVDKPTGTLVVDNWRAAEGRNDERSRATDYQRDSSSGGASRFFFRADYDEGE